MFHTAAFYESVDQAGAYANMAVPADQLLTVVTPNMQVPALNRVVLVAAGLESAVAPIGRLVAPSLRTKCLFQISPISNAAAGPVVPVDPHAVVDLRFNPLNLVPSEQLNFAAFANPAAAQIQWCGVWFADGPIAPVTGSIFTARAVGTTTLVAGAWVTCPLVFDENLPRGRYQIVGMKAISATAKLARLLLPGQQWRPGVLGCVTTQHREWPGFRYGGMGAYGEFEDIDALNADFMAGAGDTAEIVYLDLIQLRAGPG
jgi:hypothetical protein